MAGHRLNGTATTWCSFDNNRRVAATELGCLRPDQQMPITFLSGSVSDALNPNNRNTFGLTVRVTPLSGGALRGDSVGTVFIQNAEGLVEIGELQGGMNALTVRTANTAISASGHQSICFSL